MVIPFPPESRASRIGDPTAGGATWRRRRALGIPYQEVIQTALIPVAYTLGTRFAPTRRSPLETIVSRVRVMPCQVLDDRGST